MDPLFTTLVNAFEKQAARGFISPEKQRRRKVKSILTLGAIGGGVLGSLLLAPKMGRGLRNLVDNIKWIRGHAKKTGKTFGEAAQDLSQQARAEMQSAAELSKAMGKKGPSALFGTKHHKEIKPSPPAWEMN